VDRVSGDLVVLSVVVATMGGMSDLRTIRMNDGRIVVQPEPRARYLVTRRHADWADEPEVLTPLDESADVVGHGYDAMSKAELVDLADAKGLPTYGTKAQIIERLTDAQLSATAEPVGANAEDEPLSESDSDGNS
jgi:hypothetical protein